MTVRQANYQGLNDEKHVVVGPVLPVIDMEEFERQYGLLPPFPEVITRIDQLLRSGDTHVAQVSEVVATEVSLVARILRVVNSAYYGIPRQISDIKQAIAYLGFSEIQRIVLITSVAESFKDANPLQLRRFWTHSYFTALIAKDLARRFEKQVDPGELWTSALLHDVGELVYMRLYGEHYAAIIRYQLDERCGTDEAEDALNLPSHRVLGGELCKYWGLPDSIRDACLHHGLVDPPLAPANQHQRAVRKVLAAADILSSLAVDSLRPDLQASYREQVAAILSCDEGEVLRLMADVMELRDEVDRLIS